MPLYMDNESGGGGGPGSDTTAIHVDTDNELASLTEKTALTGADRIVLEDSEDGYAKKRVSVETIQEQITIGVYKNKGGYNATTNTPDLTTSPNTILNADAYTVTVAGTFFTEAVEVGDILIANQDDPSSLSNWMRVNKNISFGTTAGTACEGNDSRLTVAPTILIHGECYPEFSTYQMVYDAAKYRTLTGSARTTTQQSKFGTGSIGIGASDAFAVAESIDSDLVLAGDFTIGLFGYISSAVPATLTLFGIDDTEFKLQLTGSGTGLSLYTNGTATSWAVSVSADTWYHFAVVRDGSTISVYLDGVLLGTRTDGTEINSGDSSIAIGAKEEAGGDSFDGNIEEFLLVNGTAMQIPTGGPDKPYTMAGAVPASTAKSVLASMFSEDNTLIVAQVAGELYKLVVEEWTLIGRAGGDITKLDGEDVRSITTGMGEVDDVIQTVVDEEIPFDSAAIWQYTMIADTEFMFDNAEADRTVTLILDGDYTPTWPAEVISIVGSYVGSEVNIVRIHCIDTDDERYTLEYVNSLGDVVGPAGATDDAIATFDGVTGKLIQDSGVTVGTAPTGGSAIKVVEYGSTPVAPPAGMVWIQAKDASTKTLNYFDGVGTYSVDMAL